MRDFLKPVGRKTNMSASGQNCSFSGYNTPAAAAAVHASSTIRFRSPCASKLHKLAINLYVLHMNDETITHQHCMHFTAVSHFVLNSHGHNTSTLKKTSRPFPQTLCNSGSSGRGLATRDYHSIHMYVQYIYYGSVTI